MSTSRRGFLAGAAVTGLMATQLKAMASTCPFRLAVINDEISPDFDHACSVAANDFGLSWIEIRSMWGKNVTELDSAQIAEAKKILLKYKLRLTDIASPLFKVDFPGAPRSKESPHRDEFKAKADYEKQDALVDHCIDLAKSFGTENIRCFDFWRLEDQKPYRATINAKLTAAAEKCAKQNVNLVIENEMACNTGTGEEALAILKAIPNRNFMLNWDPGNAATFADATPYPNQYDKLPKHRIGHCHVKDTVRKDGGKFEWRPVGAGIIDWVGQFKAFKRDGYKYGVSLETHWHGPNGPEASTRESMAGLKAALVKAGITC
jgi:L-ribulose-5-phosphate 3-epimerase